MALIDELISIMQKREPSKVVRRSPRTLRTADRKVQARLLLGGILPLGGIAGPVVFDAVNSDVVTLWIGQVVIGDQATGGVLASRNQKERPVGVVVDSDIAPSASGKIAHIGYVTNVQVDGAVSAWDYLVTSDETGKAKSGSWYEFVFGMAVEDASGGTVDAMVFPVSRLYMESFVCRYSTTGHTYESMYVYK